MYDNRNSDHGDFLCEHDTEIKAQRKEIVNKRTKQCPPVNCIVAEI